MTPENKRKKERNSYKKPIYHQLFSLQVRPPFFVSYRLLIHMCFNTIPLVDGYKFTIFFFSGNQQFFFYNSFLALSCLFLLIPADKLSITVTKSCRGSRGDNNVVGPFVVVLKGKKH